MDKGMLIIISGPSGSGKGTVVKRLRELPGYSISVSVTTRERRADEANGRDYFFVSPEEFINMRDNNGLLEHATFCDHLYGTPRFYVEREIDHGNSVVLEIDVNGALQVKRQFPGCVLIFLMPPTKRELKRRLIARARESLEEIEQRFRKAEDELKLLPEYDYLVINDSIDNALAEIDLIVRAERLRPARSAWKTDRFVKEDAEL